MTTYAETRGEKPKTDNPFSQRECECGWANHDLRTKCRNCGKALEPVAPPTPKKLTIREILSQCVARMHEHGPAERFSRDEGDEYEDTLHLATFALNRAYHPDRAINAEVAEGAAQAEAEDVAAGLKPSRWRCICGAEHDKGFIRGELVHRCYECGYFGSKGIIIVPGQYDMKFDYETDLLSTPEQSAVALEKGGQA